MVHYKNYDQQGVLMNYSYSIFCIIGTYFAGTSILAWFRGTVIEISIASCTDVARSALAGVGRDTILLYNIM